MCTETLPQGGYAIAVKYIISYYIISYHIISYHIISYHIIKTVGRESSVGIATRYRLDGPGIKTPRRQVFSAPLQTSPEAHPASTMGTGSFPGVKRLGLGLENPPSSGEEDVKKRVQP